MRCRKSVWVGIVSGVVFSSSPAMANGAPVECTVSNLPPSFTLKAGVNASDGSEAIVVVWENFGSLLTADASLYPQAAIANHCRDADGVDLPGFSPQSLILVGNHLSMVLRSSDPHYRSKIKMVQQAKVNLVPLSMHIDLSKPWDNRHGWIVDAVDGN